MAAEEQQLEDKKADEKKPAPVDRIAVSRHRARIGGKQLAYTVTCGTMVLKEEAEKDGRRLEHDGNRTLLHLSRVAKSAQDHAQLSGDAAPDAVTFSPTIGLCGGTGYPETVATSRETAAS